MIEDMTLMMLMLVIVAALFGIMLGISIGIMICTDDKKCIRKVSFDSKKCTVHEIQYKLLENGKDYSTLPHDADG